MIGRLLAFILLLLTQVATGQPVVAAAANLKPALEEIAASFRRETGLALQVVYGSSGKFAAQIRADAPFDLFLSADRSFPDSVVSWGKAGGPPVVYARGRVVLWTSVADLDPAKGPTILRDPRVRKIALANPGVAPYGRSAETALASAGLEDALRSRLVLGENVATVAQYAATGAVEAAFPAKSHAQTNLSRTGRWADLDTLLAPPIDQAAVLLDHGARLHPGTSRRFLAYLLSPAVRPIWIRHGYLLP